jgi:hypothetical protein
MFTEILKIIPRLDNGDLARMERQLSTRFGRVAKKFGRGLMNSIKGGGIIGGAVAMLTKVLNPLKEVQEAINSTLKRSDDISTFSKSFGTSEGKLAKLEAIATATGLDRDALFTALNKFQSSVAEATNDPKKQTSVRNFAGRTDTVDAFFEFIQGLQGLESTQKTLVQNEVFGEKATLKLADFLNMDFNKMSKFFADIDSGKLTTSIQGLSDLNDMSDALTARRELQDLMKKSGLINAGTVSAIDKNERTKLNVENERIGRFASINDVDQKLQNITHQLEKMLTELPVVMNAVNGAIEAMKMSVNGWGLIIKTIKESRILRGLFGGK